MKRCNRCHEELPVSDFAKNKARKDGLQGCCKACQKKYNQEHYPRTKDRWKDSRAGTRDAMRKHNQAQVLLYLLEHPCVDCETSDVRVLDFDHRPGTEKVDNVSRLITRSKWETVLAEINKCDVRCRNCHVIKTYERSPSWRSVWQGTMV